MRAAILGFLLLVSGVARADSTGARGHFLAGLELYAQGRYAQALAEYQAAWVTWEDPELLLDMAECNRHLGNLDEARTQYRGFLARAPHSALRGSVERQLARLDRSDGEAPPPAELTVAAPATTSAMAADTHPGRTLRILGVTGWVLSAAAFGVGIYTWQHYSALEGRAHDDLSMLAGAGAVTNATPAERAFFTNPGCSPPSSIPNTGAYRHDCTQGQAYSAATTAMFVGSAALGIAATIAYVVGAKKASRGRERPTVAPMFAPSFGGLQARVSF